MRWLPLLAWLCSPSFGSATEPPPAGHGTLTIEVTGFAEDRAHAIANLFRQGDDVMKIKQAYKRATLEVHDRKVTFVFEDVPFGTYAVSVFHDKNDNGELDHRFGFPAEPLAFSNHFKPGLFSGLPKFDKLKFQFTPVASKIEIEFR